jgi:hypothetical protein
VNRSWSVTSLSFLLSWAAGCAQPTDYTTLEGVWRDATYDGRPLRQVVVMAIDPDESFRRPFEDRMVRALEVCGVAARPSYSLMPVGSAPARGTIEATVKGSSSDGMLVTQFDGARVHTDYVPPHVEHHPSAAFGRVHHGGQTVYELSYAYVEKEIRMTSSLYDAAGRLVWSGTTRSPAEPSDRKLDEQVDQHVLAALESAQLIP